MPRIDLLSTDLNGDHAVFRIVLKAESAPRASKASA